MFVKILLIIVAIVTAASIGTSSGLLLAKAPEKLSNTEKFIIKITSIVNPSGFVVCAALVWALHNSIIADAIIGKR